LRGIAKASNDASINFIRFGQHLDRPSKVPNTQRLRDGHVQACIMKSIADGSFIATGCFQKQISVLAVVDEGQEFLMPTGLLSKQLRNCSAFKFISFFQNRRK